MSCPDCFKGSIHDHGEARGHEEILHGLRTYVGAPSKTKISKSAILFMSDAFGVDFINSKLLADRYSEETGCKVFLPDVVVGGALPVELMAWRDIAFTSVGWFDIAAWFRRFWNLVKFLRMGIPWMIYAHPRKAHDTILKFARAVRADLPAGGKLGVCGFCWGGYPATRLCVETAVPESSKPLIDAQFVAHPGFLKLPEMVTDAVKTFGVPYSCAVAQNDVALDQTMAEQIEVQLRREVGPPEENGYEFVLYKGSPHGFALRADPADDKLGAQAMEKAAVQAVDWLNKYLN